MSGLDGYKVILLVIVVLQIATIYGLQILIKLVIALKEVLDENHS